MAGINFSNTGQISLTESGFTINTKGGLSGVSLSTGPEFWPTGYGGNHQASYQPNGVELVGNPTEVADESIDTSTAFEDEAQRAVVIAENYVYAYSNQFIKAYKVENNNVIEEWSKDFGSDSIVNAAIADKFLVLAVTGKSFYILNRFDGTSLINTTKLTAQNSTTDAGLNISNGRLCSYASNFDIYNISEGAFIDGLSSSNANKFSMLSEPSLAILVDVNLGNTETTVSAVSIEDESVEYSITKNYFRAISSFMYDSNVLYTFNSGGQYNKFNVRDGLLVQENLGPINWLPNINNIVAGMVANDGEYIYVIDTSGGTSSAELVKYNPDINSEAWRVGSFGYTDGSQPVVTDDAVYVPQQDAGISVRDKSDGSELNLIDVDSNVRNVSTPAVTSNYLAFQYGATDFTGQRLQIYK